MNKKDIEKFVRKYADLVYRVAYTILKNKDNADDIFQEVFMKLCTENVKFCMQNFNMIYYKNHRQKLNNIVEYLT